MRDFSLISFQHQPLSRRNNFPIEKGSSLYSHAAAARTIANPRLVSANIQDDDAVDDEEQAAMYVRFREAHPNASQRIPTYPNASQASASYIPNETDNCTRLMTSHSTLKDSQIVKT